MKEKTIWEEISKLPINVFALPRQKVSNYAELLAETPAGACLKLSCSAALPALEEVLAKQVVLETDSETGKVISSPKYDLKEGEGYVVVSRFETKKPDFEPLKAPFLVEKKEATDK